MYQKELTEAQFYKEIEKIKEIFLIIDEPTTLRKSIEYAENWNNELQCYEIEYICRKVDYSIIHEFGHIFLVKITKYLYFARTALELRKINEIIESKGFEYLNLEQRNLVIMWDYSNSIIDSFVDYNAFNNIANFYPFYLTHIDKMLSWLEMEVRDADLHHFLTAYTLFYLGFRYILKIEHFKSRQKRIDNFLGRLIENIVKKSALTIESFQKINRKLDYFNYIKSTQNPEKILRFIFEVLIELKLWDKNTITTDFKRVFPKISLFTK
ncbi:MAG: hypothetical protein ACTSQI_12120 [Candidatus Helarchaeota archaeon]